MFHKQLTAIPAPLFVGSSDPPGRLPFKSELLAKKVTASPLPTELPTIDALQVTRANAPRHACSAGGVMSTLLTEYPSPSTSSADVSGPVKDISEYLMERDSGHPSPRGLCNIPRPPSPDNKLVGSDGKLYDPEKKDEVDAFIQSWRVNIKDVLTKPGANPPTPGGYGTPDPDEYGTPDPDEYGTPDPDEYGTPDPDEYGTPDPDEHVSPSEDVYVRSSSP
ncbi:hypothetical protein BASA62_000388 [Batrachochytrium salamandrivorans]|nr:hypothetical protein BASA62_000388 [Batrachochytrium salamandrivorans]